MAEIVITDHAKYRLMERGIDTHEAKRIAKTGRIVKVQNDGSILKTGVCSNGKELKVAIIERLNKIIIKTLYYED